MDADAAALIRFVRVYTDMHGYPPNRREMAKYLDRSPSTTQMIVNRMIAEGLLTVTPLVARSVVVTGAAMKELDQGAL